MKRFTHVICALTFALCLPFIAGAGGWADDSTLTPARLEAGTSRYGMQAATTLKAAASTTFFDLRAWKHQGYSNLHVHVRNSSASAFSAFSANARTTVILGDTQSELVTSFLTGSVTLTTLAGNANALAVWDKDGLPDTISFTVTSGSTITAEIIVEVLP